MKFSLTLLAVLFSFSSLFAQLEIEWERSYGGGQFEFGKSVLQTSDGGYVVAGTSNSTDGDISNPLPGNNFWILRLDVEGEILWERTLGGSGLDELNTMIQTNDGGFVLAGHTRSDNGDISESFGWGDAWAIKLSGTGQLLWENSFGMNFWEERIDKIIQAPNNGLTFVGTRNHVIVGQFEVVQSQLWVAHLNVAGDLIWEESFGNNRIIESGYDILLAESGDYVVVGTIEDTLTLQNDFWVLHLNSEGNLNWDVELGGSANDIPNKINQLGTNFLVLGRTESTDGNISSNNGNEDYWMVRLGATGNILDEYTFGGSDSDVGSDFLIEGNEILSCGYSSSDDGDRSGTYGSSDIWLVNHTVNGTINWEQNFGGSALESAPKISATDDGGYVLMCNTTSSDGEVSENNGAFDIWLLKLKPCATYETTIDTLVCPGEAFALRDTLKTAYGCDSVIIYNIVELPEASAGADAIVCLDQTNILGQNLGDTIIGVWTTTSDALINSPNASTTEVQNLVPGENQFIWTLSHTSCPNYSRDTVIVNYPIFEAADAGNNQIVCSPDIQLSANQIDPQVTGIWTTSSNALILDSANPNSGVFELDPGFNEFYWTISTNLGCLNYSRDTMVVFYESERVSAVEDAYYPEVLELLEVNVLDNDDFYAPSRLRTRIVAETNADVGNLLLDSLGNLSFYLGDPTSIYSRTFSYQVYYADCSDLLDEATVTLHFHQNEDGDEEDPSFGFTPNGDGANETFVIPDLRGREAEFPNNALTVINRWGDVIYEAQPYNNDWDGTHYKTGKPVPPGTYFYRFRFSVHHPEISERVTLIR